MAEPLGIYPTKKMQDEEAARQRARQFKQDVSQGIGTAGEAVQQAARTATQPLRSAAQGISGIAQNTTLGAPILPDYAPGLLKPSAQTRAASAVAADPQTALAGQQAADEMAYRAVQAGIAPMRQAPSTQRTGRPEPQGTPAAAAEMREEPTNSQGVQDFGTAPSSRGGARNPWRETGIGIGAQGGEIVGRRNAQGIAEFTNDPAAQRRAAGDFGISGRGGFMVTPSSQSAPQAMQAQQQAGQQQGQGIRVINLGDPIRDMLTSDDPFQRRAGIAMQRERMAESELQQRAGSEQARLGIDQQRIGIDQQRAQQEQRLGDERLGIQRQELGIADRRAEQEIASSQFDMEQKRRIADLQQRYADPNTSDEERQRIAAQLSAASPQSARDQYITVSGGKVVDPESGMLVDQPGRLFDTKTKSYVTDQPQPATGATREAQQQFLLGRVYRDAFGNRSIYRGKDESGKNIWEDV